VNKVQHIPTASELTIQLYIIATNAENAEMWKMKYCLTARIFHLQQFEYLDGLMTDQKGNDQLSMLLRQGEKKSKSVK